MPVSNWSTTAASNGSTLGIDIAENCDAANINNALREMMAQLKTKMDALDTSVSSGSLSASLTALGALTNTANQIPYMTGSDAWSTKDITYLVPISCVLPFARNSAPTGFLECDGSAVSRTTYSALFAIISTVFGTGDGSTTFNVPDLRGEFIRGWDHGRGVDSGRAFGSAQSSQNLAHTHTISGGGGGSQIEAGDGGTGSTFSTSSSGGTEARPRSIALLYAIKY
jgi:microcystin-dependent protein